MSRPGLAGAAAFRALAALAGAGLLLAGCSSSPSAPPPTSPAPRIDWPLFRGDLERDGHPSGASLTAAAAARLQKAWSVDLGAEIVGSPAVAGGVVVVGTLSGVLAAYSTQQGGEVWKVKGLGPLAGSPAIAAGKVVVGSTESHLYAFDLENGNRIWDWRAPGSRPALWSSVAVFKGLLIVGIGSQLGDIPQEPGRLVALDPSSGDQVWSICARPSCEAGGSISSSPAIDATGHVFVGLGSPEDALWAIDGGIGKQLWRAALDPPSGRGRDVASTPLVMYAGRRESVAVGGAGGTFALYDARTGRLGWSRQLVEGSPAHGLAGSAAWDGAALYVPAAGAPAGVFALSPADGHTLWSHPTTELVFSSPAVGRGVVLIGTGSRFGNSGAGSLVALSAAAGQVLWSSGSGAAIVASPAIVGDSVFSADRAGLLSAFRPGP